MEGSVGLTMKGQREGGDLFGERNWSHLDHGSGSMALHLSKVLQMYSKKNALSCL